jgi:serine/threonine-protein kinase
MVYLRRVFVSVLGLGIAGIAAGPDSFRVHADVIDQALVIPMYFPAGAIWTQDVSHARIDLKSSEIINWLSNAGGWGTGKMRVDFALRVLQADSNTPTVPFRRGDEFYTPDSDEVRSVPLPPGGGMEGQADYRCPVGKEDCHLLVVDRSRNRLYEAYEARYMGGKLSAVFMGVWDLSRIYPTTGRGDQCTSADAAGFPIAPLLFNADEIATGSINHALRFILPNERIRAGVFVRPATHAGGPSGPDSAPPYGAHLRLKASYDISQLKPAAQVVARAMQKYGMFLSDGGNIALTAQNDADTKAKYPELGFDTHSLDGLLVTDFEVLETGKLIPVTYDCVRNP